MSIPPSQMRATAIGGCAVILWSSLALFTAWAGGLPPFQLLGLSFSVAFILSTVILALRKQPVLAAWHQSLPVWALGVGGLFGYHFFYFLALGRAPVAEANLLNYLWPLLIVVFSGLLPGERLRWFHVLGAALGLIGAYVLITGENSSAYDSKYAIGYSAAIMAAFIWAGYSVLNRRFKDVPTSAVSGFCGAVALFALICHGLFETTIIPDLGQSLAIMALGAGPVGGAFFLWDHATKHGQIQILGTLAYFTPLFSTILLVAVGLTKPNAQLVIACALIVTGALVAGHRIFLRTSKRSAKN